MESNDGDPVVRWYTARQAAAHSKLTPHMVNYLCRYGIVVPSECGKRGRGRLRKYSFADIVLLRVISKLSSNGVSVLRLRKSLTALQKRGYGTKDILSKRYVITDGRNVYFRNKGTIETFESGQMVFAFVLELEVLRKEVLSRVERKRIGTVG